MAAALGAFKLAAAGDVIAIPLRKAYAATTQRRRGEYWLRRFGVMLAPPFDSPGLPSTGS